MNDFDVKYICREDIEMVTEFLESSIPHIHPDDEHWKRIIERFHLALKDQ